MVQPPAGTAATGRVLGIDLGSRRIGVAVSDAERKVASALALVLRRRSHLDDHARLEELVTDTGANLVVVGLPLSLSGAAGPAARAVQDEVVELQRVLPVPVELSDERYSTVVATRVLRPRADGDATVDSWSTKWPPPPSCRHGWTARVPRCEAMATGRVRHNCDGRRPPAGGARRQRAR